METENKKINADIFFQLTKRHLLVFFKNKVRTMYTLLVPIIIFAVYIVFLRSMELTMVQNMLMEFEKEYGVSIVGDVQLQKQISTLVDSWMLSGIIGLSTITVALQTNTVLVEDKQNGVNRDFASSPISRNVLIGSYFFYNFIVTAIICFVFFLVCLVYLAAMGEFIIGFLDVLTIFCVMLYSTLASTLMTVFICSFIKTEGTMASILAVFSTAIGFLIGAYMPLGMLPNWVQGICGFIPGTYSCSLLRYGFMDTPIAQLTDYITNTIQLEGGADIIAQLTNNFGYNISFFGVSVNAQFQSLAIAIFIVLFLLLNVGVGDKISAVLGMGRKKKKK